MATKVYCNNSGDQRFTDGISYKINYTTSTTSSLVCSSQSRGTKWTLCLDDLNALEKSMLEEEHSFGLQGWLDMTLWLDVIVA